MNLDLGWESELEREEIVKGLIFPADTSRSGAPLLRATSQGDPMLSALLVHRSTGNDL